MHCKVSVDINFISLLIIIVFSFQEHHFLGRFLKRGRGSGRGLLKRGVKKIKNFIFFFIKNFYILCFIIVVTFVQLSLYIFFFLGGDTPLGPNQHTPLPPPKKKKITDKTHLG